MLAGERRVVENPKRIRYSGYSLTRMKRKNPHAVALGRRGGQIGGAVRSAIKTLAARENGKKGGRPRTAVSARGKSSE
jgi:general stress protein YciG